MSRLVRRSSLVLLGALGGIAAGCGSDGSTSPAPSQSVDVAAVVSQIAAGGLGAYPGLQATGLGATAGPGLPAGVVTNCPYSAATQAFVCPAYTNGGITYTVSYWLYDASGHPLSRVDASGIGSIRTVADFSGTISTAVGSGPGTNITEHGHNDMTMSGLLTDSRTLNGTSTAHAEATAGNESSVADVTTVTTNVVTPASPSNGSQWPKSGTIGVDVKTGAASGSTSANVLVHSLVTFNGTNIVHMTTSLNGVVATTCTINLETGSVACF